MPTARRAATSPMPGSGCREAKTTLAPSAARNETTTTRSEFALLHRVLRLAAPLRGEAVARGAGAELSAGVQRRPIAVVPGREGVDSRAHRADCRPARAVPLDDPVALAACVERWSAAVVMHEQ